MMTTRCRFALLLVLLALGTPPTLGQQVQEDQDTTLVKTQQQKPPPRFGGPSSVSGTIRRDKRVKFTASTYFDYKDWI